MLTVIEGVSLSKAVLLRDYQKTLMHPQWRIMLSNEVGNPGIKFEPFIKIKLDQHIRRQRQYADVISQAIHGNIRRTIKYYFRLPDISHIFTTPQQIAL